MAEKRILKPFTMESLRRLPSAEPGQRDVYHHPRIQGLIVRVASSGTKSFCVVARCRVSGMIRETLGTFPRLSVDQAERLAKDALARLAKGEPLAKKIQVKETLQELLDWYIGQTGARKPSTNRYYQYLAEHYLKKLAKRRCDSIERSEVLALHQSISQRGKLHLANRIVALLRAAYQAGLNAERIAGNNPAANLKMNREVSREVRLLDHQIPSVIAAVERYPDEIVRAFFMLAFLTGQRKSNILAMKWQDVHLDSRLWIIPDTKNNRPQNVPLQEGEIRILEELKRSRGESRSPWVLPSHGKTGHLIEVKGAWRKILEDAGVSGMNVRVHDIRRTFGSVMAEQGAPTAIIAKALGHANQATTRVYERISQGPVAEAKARTHAVMMKGRGDASGGDMGRSDKESGEG